MIIPNEHIKTSNLCPINVTCVTGSTVRRLAPSVVVEVEAMDAHIVQLAGHLSKENQVALTA